MCLCVCVPVYKAHMPTSKLHLAPGWPALPQLLPSSLCRADRDYSALLSARFRYASSGEEEEEEELEGSRGGGLRLSGAE